MGLLDRLLKPRRVTPFEGIALLREADEELQRGRHSKKVEHKYVLELQDDNPIRVPLFITSRKGAENRAKNKSIRDLATYASQGEVLRLKGTVTGNSSYEGEVRVNEGVRAGEIDSAHYWFRVDERKANSPRDQKISDMHAVVSEIILPFLHKEGVEAEQTGRPSYDGNITNALLSPRLIERLADGTYKVVLEPSEKETGYKLLDRDYSKAAFLQQDGQVSITSRWKKKLLIPEPPIREVVLKNESRESRYRREL